ncbi:hypothetical protein EVAR_100187_1 [Eumeta japonica]|uniref:Uncharacterized protein n=1 Tax=Eumeta variegata TaxID=151549 RepID=A0A4C2A7A0_EUMVA|nr:hypothetical protein EVAR_100187_1 [Eumeta japonica]
MLTFNVALRSVRIRISLRHTKLNIQRASVVLWLRSSSSNREVLDSILTADELTDEYFNFNLYHERHVSESLKAVGPGLSLLGNVDGVLTNRLSSVSTPSMQRKKDDAAPSRLSAFASLARYRFAGNLIKY